MRLPCHVWHSLLAATAFSLRTMRHPRALPLPPELLQVLDDRGIDITLIRKPDDFPVPVHYADHPLVRKLGVNAL